MTSKFSIKGGEADAHRVRADELVRVVEQLQQLTLLLGANRIGTSFKQRFRPSTELRERFQVVLQLPEKGSYALAWQVQDDRRAPALALDVSGEDVESDAHEFFRALSQGDDGWLQANVKDVALQRRLLNEADKLLPAAGSAYTLDFILGPDLVVLDAGVSQTIRQWQERLTAEPEVVRQTFTGQLTEMKFDRRTITVFDPVAKREVECFYGDDIEPMLTTARRQFVQINGVFTLGADGFPIKVTDVIRIEPLNLDSIHIEDIKIDGIDHRLPKRLVFAPRLDDETGQLLVVDDDELSLHAAASTRAELVDEIRQLLSFLANEYALADPTTLTPRAALLRQRLRAAMGLHDAA